MHIFCLFLFESIQLWWNWKCSCPFYVNLCIFAVFTVWLCLTWALQVFEVFWILRLLWEFYQLFEFANNQQKQLCLNCKKQIADVSGFAQFAHLHDLWEFWKVSNIFNLIDFLSMKACYHELITNVNNLQTNLYFFLVKEIPHILQNPILIGFSSIRKFKVMISIM